MSQKATEGFSVDARVTVLETIGGYDCYPDMPQRVPDLYVKGGARILQTACLEGPLTLIKGETTVQGNLTVLQNSFLQTTYVTKLFADDICTGNLEVDQLTGNTATFVDLTVTGNTSTNIITGNTATFVDLTVDSNVVSNGETCLNGNLKVLGNTDLNTITANSATITGKLTVEGLIDPTGLVLDAQSVSPIAVPTTGKGALWVETGNVYSTQLFFDDDDGNTHPIFMADGIIPITGNVDVQTDTESNAPSEGAIVVAGGIGISKNIIGGQAVAGGFGLVFADDAGSLLLGNVLVCVVIEGNVSGAFDLEPPVEMLAGQVIHVYNNTSFNTSGNVVTVSGSGATIVSDGMSWFQL